MSHCYIGLMSGTSLDAIDAVLLDCSKGLKLVHALTLPIPPDLKEKTRALNHSSNSDLEQSLQLDRRWGFLFAEAVQQLLQESNTDKSRVRAIGSHGQTVRHAPQGQYGYTLQIGDPNTLCELTGLDVVADFRRRDIAAGGQGAPLASAFHRAIMSSPRENRAVINIGGMANMTRLHDGIAGFDTGPGNVLMNDWVQRHQGKAYDNNGSWAAQGRVITDLLNRMLADPYFALPAPKSTGREHFDRHWLARQLQGDEKPADVQATLAELTARSISDALHPATEALYICGGGAANPHLMQRLQTLSGRPVKSTAALGVDPDWLEGMAFAWLASQTLAHKSGNEPAVTGAAGERILGAIYQA